MLEHVLPALSVLASALATLALGLSAAAWWRSSANELHRVARRHQAQVEDALQAHQQELRAEFAAWSDRMEDLAATTETRRRRAAAAESKVRAREEQAAQGPPDYSDPEVREQIRKEILSRGRVQ